MFINSRGKSCGRLNFDNHISFYKNLSQLVLMDHTGTTLVETILIYFKYPKN